MIRVWVPVASYTATALGSCGLSGSRTSQAYRLTGVEVACAAGFLVVCLAAEL
jgi:hypothetical protein